MYSSKKSSTANWYRSRIGVILKTIIGNIFWSMIDTGLAEAYHLLLIVIILVDNHKFMLRHQLAIDDAVVNVF